MYDFYLCSCIPLHMDNQYNPRIGNNPFWFHTRLPSHISGFQYVTTAFRCGRQSDLFPLYRVSYLSDTDSLCFSFSFPNETCYISHSCPDSFLTDIHNSLRCHSLHLQRCFPVIALIFFLNVLSGGSWFWCPLDLDGW